MKHERLAIPVGLIMLLGLIVACSPSKIDSSSAGAVITTPTGTVAASALALSANPSTIAPSGSSVISAHVVDNLGNNVPDGTVVNFAFAPGDQVKARLSNGSVQTVNGVATVTVTATTFSSAIATINASSGSASASIAITITAGVSGGTVTVSVSPSTITAGNTSNISATVKDSGGNPVANATVNFSLNNNTLATLSLSSAATNSNGVATTVLTGNAAGSITVTASVPSLGGTSGQANITINSVSLVPTITVSSTASSILTNGNTTITAVMSGFSGVSGQNVTFAVGNASAAYLLSSSPTATGALVTATTDTNGVATVTLQANNIVTPVTVTASYAAQSLTGTTTITISAPPPDTVVVTPNLNPITVYGTSTITATVTGAGKPVPDGTLVNFIISDGTYGSLSNAIGSTVGGNAITTFSALAKVGSVTLSATAGSVSATTTVSIQAANSASIQFVSAVPQVIGLQGSGQTESSTITFTVKDVNGNPVADGTTVSFAMNGPGGGSYIGSVVSSQTATASTVSGNASTILHSGTTAGPVTIIATTQTPSGPISTSAAQISIGGGVPSAGHWNLSTSQFSLAGLSISDLQATISAYIADRFGNYNILTGTAINFYTEGGAIDRQGITDSTGKTSVTLRTQAPNPVDVSNAVAGDTVSKLYFAGLAEPWYPGGNNTYNNNPRDGWVTVFATTMGEEAFLDENGDGLFTRSFSASACPGGYTCECDDNGAANTYKGCITSQTNGSASCIAASTCAAVPAFGLSSKRSEGFIDLGEPFYDKNDNGTRDDGSVAGAPFEEFIDANLNGIYDGPNGVWDGPGCQSTGCLTSKMIWKETKLVFTYNVFSFWPNGDGTNCFVNYSGCTAKFDNNGASAPFAVAPTYISTGSSGYFCVNVADANLNSPPGGTVINATASPVGTVTPTSVTLADGLSYGPAPFCFTVAIDKAATAPSTLVSVSIANTPTLASLSVPITLPPPPAAPTNVQAAALPTPGQIRVSWNIVSGATAYNVYYSTSSSVTKLNGTLLSPQPTVTQANVTGLASGSTYYFVVTAVGPGGESSESAPAASATAP